MVFHVSLRTLHQSNSLCYPSKRCQKQEGFCSSKGFAFEFGEIEPSRIFILKHYERNVKRHNAGGESFKLHRVTIDNRKDDKMDHEWLFWDS